MKTTICIISAIVGTQALGGSSTTSYGQAECYKWNNKYWTGTAPAAPVNSECGSTVCTVCANPPPKASDPKEPEIPIWKKTGYLWSGNSNYDGFSNEYGVQTGFSQDDYTRDSQVDGAIDKIKWCQTTQLGIMIEYGLKSFCKGEITDRQILVGKTQFANSYPAQYCQTLQLAVQGECITQGGWFRNNKDVVDENGIVGLWGFTCYNNTVTIGAYGMIEANPKSDMSRVSGYQNIYNEKAFTLPQVTQRNRTCLVGLDLMTWGTQFRNVNLVYNAGIRCGANDLGITASIASLAIGLAAVALM